MSANVERLNILLVSLEAANENVQRTAVMAEDFGPGPVCHHAILLCF